MSPKYPTFQPATEDRLPGTISDEI